MCDSLAIDERKAPDAECMIEVPNGECEEVVPEGMSAYDFILEENEAEDEWHAVTESCLLFGDQYVEWGDSSRAHMWYARAKAAAIVAERIGDVDDIGPGEQDQYDVACESVEKVECFPELSAKLDAGVCETYETLSPLNRFYWGFFALCRTEQLLLGLSKLQCCAPLADIHWILDWLQTLDGDSDLMGRLAAYSKFLEEWVVSRFYADSRQQLAVPGNAPFTPMDLELDETVDVLQRFFTSISHSSVIRDPALTYQQKIQRIYESEMGESEMDIVAGPALVCSGMLTGYWLRTFSCPLERVPQVQTELNNIKDDLAFLQGNPTADDIQARIDRYRDWNLFVGHPVNL